MKRQVTAGYVFAPSTATLDLGGIVGLTAPNLLAVLNVTAGELVYAVGTPGFGASAITGKVLTLEASLVGMAPGDSLAVIFDDGAVAAQDATVASVTASLGTDGATPPALPGGATGVRGWLRSIAAALAGTLTVQQTLGGAALSPTNRLPVEIDAGSVTLQIAAAALPLPAGAAQDGTDATGVAPPPGGAGLRGWLSGIYGALSGTLTTKLAAGTAVIGGVTQSGAWAVNASLQPGSAIIGRAGLDQTTPGTTNGVVVNGSALPNGAATETTLQGVVSAIQALTAAINAQSSGSGGSTSPSPSGGTADFTQPANSGLVAAIAA